MRGVDKSEKTDQLLLPALERPNGENGGSRIRIPKFSEHDLTNLVKKFHSQDPRTRKWLRIDSHGQAEVVEMDKHTLVERLGIPYRDLRQMDPFIAQPYPAAILVREKAIVLSLESIRLITGKDECFVLTVPDPTGQEPAGVFPHKDSPLVRDLMLLLEYDASPDAAPVKGEVRELLKHKFLDADLPYELRVTEAALTEFIRLLHGELAGLERTIYPQLLRIADTVSRSALDRLRDFKTDVKAVSQRIGRVRRIVEDILDDDQDMADMYLGRRATEGADDDESSPEEAQPASPPPAAEDGESALTSPEEHTAAMISRMSAMSADIIRSSVREWARKQERQKAKQVHPHDISECEDMLEVYFMQLDFVFGRLATLNEAVEDTEDLIEVDLDHRRNEMVLLNLVVNGVTLMFAVVSAVTGAFGMNLNAWMPQGTKQSARGWAMAVAFSSLAGAVILLAILTFAKWRRLLSLPGGADAG